jgi:glucose-1-phosphate cytidylyltransferase
MERQSMQAVILAGGLGTRIAEETDSRPKPLVEIGGLPILVHIMNIYSAYGINDFIICAGYKSYLIKEFFANYLVHTSDCTFALATGEVEVHRTRAKPWKVTVVDTGLNSMTGGRLKYVAEYIKSETFCFTYGDGLANINIQNLIEFHRSHGGLATVTAVTPPGRFGVVELSKESTRVVSFSEKRSSEVGSINGGFFVLDKRCLEYIDGEDTVWEEKPLRDLAKFGQLYAYKHDGFWQPMDTVREKRYLEELWNSGDAPWLM